MQEGALVIGQEGVRHPDPLGEVSRQRETLVVVRGELQAFVTPVLVQVHRDRVVLQSTETQFRLRIIVETMFINTISTTKEHRRVSMQTPALVQVHRDRIVLQSTETHQVRLSIIVETMFRCNIEHRRTPQRHHADTSTGSGTS